MARAMLSRRWRWLTAAVLAGCGGGSAAAPPVVAGVVDDSTLGPADVFDVRVYGEEQLSGSYRIAQDGTIDFPFVGRVQVAGIEATAVADLIRQRLIEAQYLRAPQVSIFVRELNSRQVSVMGAVTRPGTQPVSNGLTVVQAISSAGGFSPLASRNSTIVSRRVNGRLLRFRVAAGDVAEGAADDFPLQAGDIVFVPERIF